MPIDRLSVRALAGELATAMPSLTPDHRGSDCPIHRGSPTASPPHQISCRASRCGGRHRAQHPRPLARRPLERRDGVGLWGVSLELTAHRLLASGQTLLAWCAWDTLFLPELIGQRADIRSACRTTEPITLSVDPTTAISRTQPAEAVVSMLRPDKPFSADMVTRFCHFVHFFRDISAAASWMVRRPGAFPMSIQDGFELGRLTNRAKFGVALAAAAVGRPAAASDLPDVRRRLTWRQARLRRIIDSWSPSS